MNAKKHRRYRACNDVDSHDLFPDTFESYDPPNPDEFVILVEATCGPSGGVGGELFGLSVCSPNGLARATMTENSKGFEFVRHRLVVERWDPHLIRRAIEGLCRSSTGETWREVAEKLARYMHWESEDYRDVP